MEIKKGDQFLCIKSIRESISVEGYGTIRSISFEQGKVYTSERDGEITDDNGQGVYWTDSFADKNFDKLPLINPSPIDFIRFFNLGPHLSNVVKLIAWAGKNDPSREIEDLKKAKWYLDIRISQLEAKPQH